MSRRSDISEAPAIGHAIDTNTKAYDRIFGMLLGVRVHVSRFINRKRKEEEITDKFNIVEKIEIPREGNHQFPGHKGRYDYKFKTYAPLAFMELRHYFGITDDEYLVSVTADYMMSELKTIGRSSAMFYYTWDGRYVLKTLTKQEMGVLREMLPRYHQYVMNHPDTLVNQFFGAYRSQTSIGRPIRFVIMNNVFPIGFQIHYKFDLKGSKVNREVSEEKRQRPGSTWKEAEFRQKRYMQIGPRDWTLLRAQLMDDTNFLSNVGVMDYSLLVGIHKFNPDSPIMHPAMGERIEILSVFTPDQSSSSRYGGNSVIVKKMQLKGGKKTKKKKIAPTVKAKLNFVPERQFAAVMPGYVSNESQKLLSFCGGLRGSNEMDEPVSEIYFMGIIDFLQGYGAGKKAEHFFKRAVYSKSAMSCVRPDKYSSRMFDFLCATMGPAEPITPERADMLERRRKRLAEMARPRPPEMIEAEPSPLTWEGQESDEEPVKKKAKTWKEKMKEKKEKDRLKQERKEKEKQDKKERERQEKEEKLERKRQHELEKEEKKGKRLTRPAFGLAMRKRTQSEADVRKMGSMLPKPSDGSSILAEGELPLSKDVAESSLGFGGAMPPSPLSMNIGSLSSSSASSEPAPPRKRPPIPIPPMKLQIAAQDVASGTSEAAEAPAIEIAGQRELARRPSVVISEPAITESLAFDVSDEKPEQLPAPVEVKPEAQPLKPTMPELLMPISNDFSTESSSSGTPSRSASTGSVSSSVEPEPEKSESASSSSSSEASTSESSSSSSDSESD